MSKMPAACRSFHRVVLKVVGQPLGVGIVGGGLEVGHGEANLLDAEAGAGANPILRGSAERGGGENRRKG